MMDAAAPRLAALVPSTPTGPEECQDLMALDFKSHYFQHSPTSRATRDGFLMPISRRLTLTSKEALKLLQWVNPDVRGG